MTDTKTITLPDKIKSTNTMLAALRLFQAELDKNPEGYGLEQFGELLSVDEINGLCESINFGDEPRPSTEEIDGLAYRIKALMMDHYKIGWKDPDGYRIKPWGVDINHGQYVDLTFSLQSPAIVENKANTDVYVKIKFTIDIEDLSLSRMSALNSGELGDECDLPVSLVLQKEVNAACELLIQEQLAVLSKHNIALNSVDRMDDWIDSSRLETASDKFKELCDLLESHYADHQDLDHMDYDVLSNGFNGDFLEGDFAAVFGLNLEDNPIGVNITCSTTLNKGDREDFNYKVDTRFSASLHSLSTMSHYVSHVEVPRLLNGHITFFCKILAKKHRAFLASHGIESSVNAVPVWDHLIAENNSAVLVNEVSHEDNEDEDEGHSPS